VSTGDLDLLRTDVETLFVLDRRGRIVGTNSLDRPAIPAPRMHLAGCASGNMVFFRHDVQDGTVRAVQALADSEAPLTDVGAAMERGETYAALFAKDAGESRWEVGLTYLLPNTVEHSHAVPVVRSGTREGGRLLKRIRAGRMPAALRDVGFAAVDEFWEPWCAALDGDDIASLAFAARLGERGAEAGVTTVRGMRGRGFAAAATAGWASHPALDGRVLFYSTSIQNASSQRVPARLGLRLLGFSLSILD
jgi:hypothetical protein